MEARPSNECLFHTFQKSCIRNIKGKHDFLEQILMFKIFNTSLKFILLPFKRHYFSALFSTYLRKKDQHPTFNTPLFLGSLKYPIKQTYSNSRFQHKCIFNIFSNTVLVLSPLRKTLTRTWEHIPEGDFQFSHTMVSHYGCIRQNDSMQSSLTRVQEHN